MLKFMIKPSLFMASSLLFLSPVVHAMDGGINAIREDQRTLLATYVSAKKSFITQEADDKYNWIADSFQYAHPTSWVPAQLFLENPSHAIKQQIQESFGSYCNDKGINLANAQPLLTCFLDRYTPSFEKFDATHNQIRTLLIQNEVSLKGKIAGDGVNQAFKQDLMSIAETLYATLDQDLKAIKNIEKIAPEQLLDCAQGK